MSLIKIHITQKNDTLISISSQYQCSLEKILLLNPLFKYRNPTIGQIVYVEVLDSIKKNEKIIIPENILYQITLLNKNDFTSYINQFNDHVLIENELFDCYKKLSQNLNLEINDQEIFVSQIYSLHKKYHLFIDALKNKNETEIKNKQEEIKQSIINISTFLTNKKINHAIKEISSTIEQRMLIIIKLINNNYYEIYQEIKKDHSNE